jgi:hypothetical protein
VLLPNNPPARDTGTQSNPLYTRPSTLESWMQTLLNVTNFLRSKNNYYKNLFLLSQ